MSGLPNVGLGEPTAYRVTLRKPAPPDEPESPAEELEGEEEQEEQEELADEEGQEDEDHPGKPAVTDLPDAKLDGEKTPHRERLQIALSYWVSQAAAEIKDISERPGGIAHLQPESWAAYRARVASRSWLPEGQSGGWLEWAPVVYHFTLGPLGFAAGHAVVLLTTRLSWLLSAALLLGAITVLRALI